jgi:hypothetical protein
MNFVRIPKEEYKQVTLTLPNGAVLRSKSTFSKTNFWRTYHNVHSKQVKLQMPLVGSFSSGSDMHLAVLDYDVLPKGYTWEQLENELWELPGIRVCRTISGHLKGFLVFKWHNHHPSTNQVIARLKEVIPESLHGFDNKGVSKFFLSEGVAECLKDLHLSSFLDWCEEYKDSNIVQEMNSVVDSYTFSYHMADEDQLPAELTPFINTSKRGSDKRIKFCIILVAMFGLANKDGFSLPQKSLAEQVGVSSGVVAAWLEWFRINGLLKKVSNSYIVGLKAIKYTAQGPLLEAIKSRRVSINYSITLPKRPPQDGGFYRYFLSLSKKLPNWLDYKTVVAELPGIQYKGRYKMAERIFKLDRIKEQRT